MGVCGGVSPLPPLPTPAINNSSSIMRGGNVSIGSNGGISKAGYPGEGATPVEALAVVSVAEAMAT